MALLATEISAGTKSEIVSRVYLAMRRSARNAPSEEQIIDSEV